MDISPLSSLLGKEEEIPTELCQIHPGAIALTDYLCLHQIIFSPLFPHPHCFLQINHLIQDKVHSRQNTRF